MIYSIFVFGIDHAGKTALISSLKENKPIEDTKPTITFNIDKFILEKTEFYIWDAPGQKSLRKVWKKGFEQAKIMIFVLDLSTPSKFQEAFDEFYKVTSNPITSGIPLIFCFHKSDLINNPTEIIEAKSFFQFEKIKYRKIVHLSTSIKEFDTVLILKNKILDTVLMRAEKAEFSMNVIYNISHDFKNILTVISGNIDFLKNQNTDKSLDLIITDIKKAANDGNELIENLDYFQEQSDYNTSLESVIPIIESSLSFITRGTKCKTQIEIEQAFPLILINQVSFSQVINNLLLNATDAMPNGGLICVELKRVHLTVNNAKDYNLVGSDIKYGDYVLISITDDGVGIPKENQENIFNMFYTTKKTGTGLGLAGVYSIMVKHEGYVSFHSVDGDGTTFNLFFPL
jgi:small GTP-binding protein